MLVAGCDIGSTTGKVTIMADDQIIAHSIVPTEPLCEDTAHKAMSQALAQAGLAPEDVEYVVGTGYGRLVIPFAQATVTEISCHGMGAFWADPAIRTIMDIGGQDCKAIRIDEEGRVVEFAMNDKCAAGTGRFLEETARGLGVEVWDLGPISGEAQETIKLSSSCSVFAETEVMTLLNEGKDIAAIAAGINQSIASRLSALVRRVGVAEKVVISGGVSKNGGVVRGIEQRLGVSLTHVRVDAQLLGAVGAAVFAKRALAKRSRLGERRAARRAGAV